MTDNRFIPGVTDQGPPRAAKGGFPYPGHGTLEHVRLGEDARSAMLLCLLSARPRQLREFGLAGGTRLWIGAAQRLQREGMAVSVYEPRVSSLVWRLTDKGQQAKAERAA